MTFSKVAGVSDGFGPISKAVRFHWEHTKTNECLNNVITVLLSYLNKLSKGLALFKYQREHLVLLSRLESHERCGFFGPTAFVMLIIFKGLWIVSAFLGGNCALFEKKTI